MEASTLIRFSQRMDKLPPYLFGMINKMKMERRWNGEDVIDLGMGNPVDPAPDTVIGKLCEVAQDPKTHRYPVAGGMRNLRREIATYYQRNYAVGLASEKEVICTIGSKEGISHLCLALVGPGDTVLVAAPAFPIHVYAAVIAGANVIRVPIASEDEFVTMRSARDKKLDMPVLILPSVQVNMRAGHFPPQEENGVSYLKIPLDAI